MVTVLVVNIDSHACKADKQTPMFSADANIFLIVWTVIGLCIFEIVSSLDNAIVNAQVLATMSMKARKWFLFWGERENAVRAC